MIGYVELREAKDTTFLNQIRNPKVNIIDDDDDDDDDDEQ